MGHEDLPTDEIEAGRGDRTTAGLAEPSEIGSGRRLGGRYLLERRLGHGGMAVVWLATDERLGPPVAVKVLSDTLTAEPTTSAASPARPGWPPGSSIRTWSRSTTTTPARGRTW